MAKEISVAVRNKIASYPGKTAYVCGNSDFVVVFDFDEEWGEFPEKTARFIHSGEHTDVVFEGNRCAIPIISNTLTIKVGVFAGDLRTTTPAYIPARKSILCGGGAPAAPANDVYNQLMELINDLVTRIEALEAGGGGSGGGPTTSLLGSAVLGNMILGG